MTFSYNARREASMLKLDSECCYLAELSAIIRTSSEIKIEQNKFAVVIKTGIQELYAKVNSILERLYGFSVELELSTDESFLHNIRYEIKIPIEVASTVLKDCGIIYKDENHQTLFNSGIDKYLIMDDCCAKSYIRGAFIGTSTNNIVLTNSQGYSKRSNSGYHLEFVFSNNILATDFSHLLANFNIISKKVERKGSFIVYLKEGEAISDLLALIGASHSVLELQNEITFRSLRNKINRQNNCMTGNIGKVVDASLRQINAIKTIQETIGLEELSVNLQEAAMLRLANQEESLDRLVQLSSKPITKSGLSHRFRKIIKIASELKAE